DEIIGDNIYSAIVNFTQAEGQLRLKAVAEVQQSEGVIAGGSNVNVLSVFADFSSPELNILLNTQNEAYNKFDEYLQGNVNNIESAIAQVVTWLQTQPGVAEVLSDGTSNIEIRYTSNVYGGIVFAQEDDFGSIITRGGVLLQDDRKNNYRPIPVRSQTRGTTDETKIPLSTKKISDLDPNIIGNRNVMIYAPYEAAFAPANEGQRIKDILNASDFK